MTRELRSILVATDLSPVSDAVVRQAAALAAAADAALHVLHVVPGPPGPRADEIRARTDALRKAETLLHDQLQRCAPDARPASRVVHVGVPHTSIAVRRREVDAQLVVIGPHGGKGFRARILGTTADRVLHDADVPCLVIRGEGGPPWHRIGVPTDLSGAARRALAAALRLPHGPKDAPTEVTLVHVAWTVTREDDPTHAERVLTPGMREELESVDRGDDVRLRTEVIWADEPSRALVRWAHRRRIDLLVVPTHGERGVRRTLLGSTSSALARHAHCPVLMVPAGGEPAARRPRLERVVIGVDLSDASTAAVAWTTKHLAPTAEHVLVHAIDVMEPPAFIDRGAAAREELAEGARLLADRRLREITRQLGLRRPLVELREGRAADVLGAAALDHDADLIIVGEHTHSRGLFSALGTTAERLVRCGPVPIMLARGTHEQPPRRILVAVDPSSHAASALSWGHFLASTWNAELAVCHALDPAFIGRAHLVSGIAASRRLENSYGDQGRAWLGELLVRRPEDFSQAEMLVPIGDAAFEILAAQRRSGFDLVVMGSRGQGGLMRGLLGSVATAVLRGATCPVLVVRNGGCDAY